MKLRIDIYHHFPQEGGVSTLEILNSINQKLQIMSKTIGELQIQVEELQVSLDEKQAALEAANAQKAQTILDLTAALDLANANAVEGGTVEERQALSDKLAAIKADLESTPV